MGYIVGEDRKQNLLFPVSLEEYITEESPVRLFDAFVNKLDLKELNFLRETPKKEGRPGYDPRDMLKLYIYSYYYRIRSSRQIERECTVNLEIMWLIGKLTPDFRTIANFRKDNAEGLKKVLKEFNKICYKQNLFSNEGISIDGSKFKAVNAKDNNFTQSKLDDKLARLDEHVKEYLKELDAEDLSEEEFKGLEKKLQEYKERMEISLFKKMNLKPIQKTQCSRQTASFMNRNEMFLKSGRMGKSVFDIAWLDDETISLFKSDFKFVAKYIQTKRLNKDYIPTKGR